jgi:hypothetical protein
MHRLILCSHRLHATNYSIVMCCHNGPALTETMAVNCGVRSPASHESKGVVPPAPWRVGQARPMAYSVAPAGYSVRPMSAPLAGLDRCQPFFMGLVRASLLVWRAWKRCCDMHRLILCSLVLHVFFLCGV